MAFLFSAMDPQKTVIQEAPRVGNPPQEIATLTVGGKTVELPVTTGSEREKGIDITRLRGQTGAITLDPGYANTGATLSAITSLDGERGILRYRGIPIEQLAEGAT